ncbi:MAG: metal ABC transporter permease, partial [Corynebacterium sp.]|nr:metal ABC transporter permease [Corynebacterium sp.]
GPLARARRVGRGVGRVMVVAALMGGAQGYVGLLVSWYAETAAGATITLLGGVIFLVVLAAKSLLCKVVPHTANDNQYR